MSLYVAVVALLILFFTPSHPEVFTEEHNLVYEGHRTTSSLLTPPPVPQQPLAFASYSDVVGEEVLLVGLVFRPPLDVVIGVFEDQQPLSLTSVRRERRLQLEKKSRIFRRK